MLTIYIQSLFNVGGGLEYKYTSRYDYNGNLIETLEIHYLSDGRFDYKNSEKYSYDNNS